LIFFFFGVVWLIQNVFVYLPRKLQVMLSYLIAIQEEPLTNVAIKVASGSVGQSRGKPGFAELQSMPWGKKN